MAQWRGCAYRISAINSPSSDTVNRIEDLIGMVLFSEGIDKQSK